MGKNKYIMYPQSVISASNLILTEVKLLADLENIATEEQKKAISIICKSYETLYFRVREVANDFEEYKEFSDIAKLLHNILDKD